ncbi:MAG: alpha/beta hydrolase [Flavobacterium sp.]
MKKLYFLFSFWAVTTVQIYAQNETIKIWPDKIPNSIADPSYSEERTVKDGQVQRISKVTEPELTLYKSNQPNGTAVLILPGGGYGHLSMQNEGEKVAQWLNSLGITTFVLKYRLPSSLIMKDKTTGPLQDVQEAMRIIRRNAESWKINPQKVGVIGFSAGGHLAATLATQYNRQVYTPIDIISARPDFCMLIYPVISMTEGVTHKVSRTNLLGETPPEPLVKQFSAEMNVTVDTPPTFIIHAENDKSVPVENSRLYFRALKNNRVPAELHVYETGGHGFGLGAEGASSYWQGDCITWMKVYLWL